MDQLIGIINKIKKQNIEIDSDQISQAYLVAKKAYSKEVRKATGEPYINHPISICALLEKLFSSFDENLKNKIQKNGTLILSIILLHDVLEDSTYTNKTLENELNVDSFFASKITEGVCLLSKNYVYNKQKKIFEINKNFATYKKIMSESLEIQYFLKIIQCESRFWHENHEIIFLIKCLDILHNTSTLTGLKKEKEMNIFKKTINIWLPVINDNFPSIYKEIILNMYTPDRMQEAEKEGILKIQK